MRGFLAQLELIVNAKVHDSFFGADYFTADLKLAQERLFAVRCGHGALACGGCPLRSGAPHRSCPPPRVG
jgi:hypothetical protein